MLVLLAQNIKKDFTVIQENISVEFFLLGRGDVIYESPMMPFQILARRLSFPSN